MAKARAKAKAAKAKAAKAKARTRVSAKNPLGIAPFDAADYLRTPQEIATYLEAFFEDGIDRESLIHALGVIARARGMMRLSKDTGITRGGLYKALSPDGNPSFETVMKIIGAFGVRLTTADAA